MGRTISQQPASTAGSEETTNLSRNNQSPVTASPPPSPPRMGTLTSPDRDAQAAARVVVVETTRDTGEVSVSVSISKRRTTLNAAAETNLKQGNNQVTQTKADTTHAHDTVSQAEGKDTTSSGTGSAVHVGDSEGAASVTGTENGKAGGHNKKVRPAHSGPVVHPLICQRSSSLP
ncbi:hypothetical protein JB92DRAFT_207582 [Gautieria morchelliformis]|nr:hypothetical protein JB92DRAFT_207582 [Gautieria morchelliformis]